MSGGTLPPPPDPVYIFRPHAGEIAALKYVNLGTRGALVSGTASAQLSLWNLDTKRQSWVQTCSKPIIAVDSLESGRIISQCRSGVVEMWNVEAQTKECSFSIANPGFCRFDKCGGGASFPSELTSGCFAVADSNHGKVNIYSPSSQKLVSYLAVKEPKSKGMCTCVKWYVSPNGVAYILAGFEDGSVVLWDYRNNKSELAALKLFSEPVLCLDFDERRLCGVCGSPLKTLEFFSFLCDQNLSPMAIAEGDIMKLKVSYWIYPARSGKIQDCIILFRYERLIFPDNVKGQLQKKCSVELRNGGVAHVAVRADSRIMASGGWDGRIRVFSWKKGKPLAILNYHQATVTCVTFSGASATPEDSNLLACGSRDERISLWILY